MGLPKFATGQVLSGNPLYPCGSGIFGAGCNMAFKREVLLKLGGFDEALDTGAPLPGGGRFRYFLSYHSRGLSSNIRTTIPNLPSTPSGNGEAAPSILDLGD